MAFVAALPTESERKAMGPKDFTYAVFYRFLQNVCINVRAVNPALGAESRKLEASTSDARGNVTHVATETTSVAEGANRS